ncbi:alanine racemase [Haliangium sp.]|uniref:alanine racemase n=1 Tax=Haliangium sp. TaxID=2663208 RepID=UPI003D0C3560
MRAPAIRPTRVEVDIDALRANAARLRALAGTELYAVVKADAYGHGARVVARYLADEGAVSGLCVSLVEEGCELREAGIELPILVMGPALAGGYDEIVGRDLTAVISDLGDIDGLRAAVRRHGRGPVSVHLKVDTGMGRLGLQADDLAVAIERLSTASELTVVGLMTHFACADSDDPADPDCMTYAQLARFERALSRVRSAGMDITCEHAANSAGTLLFPAARRDLVRCGLALYGNSPRAPADLLEQSVRLVTEVAQIREVPAGAAVSYGALWRAPRRSRLAVLPIGYADGVPRRVGGRAEVLVAGRRCPVVGAVSMDISVADVTDLGDAVQVGAEVVLLGRQGDEHIAVAELAAWAELSEYEVTCGLSKRVPRVYRTTRPRRGEPRSRHSWPTQPEAHG